MCSIILYKPLILLIFIQCGTLLTCVTQQSPHHVWVSASLWASRPLYGPWTSPTHSPLPSGLFTSSMHHPWVSRTPFIGTTCQPTRTSMGTPHVYVHGNLTPHHYLAPLVIFLCWAFLFFLFFSRIFVCGPFRLFLSPLGRDHEHITTFAAHHHGLWYHLLGR